MGFSVLLIFKSAIVQYWNLSDHNIGLWTVLKNSVVSNVKRKSAACKQHENSLNTRFVGLDVVSSVSFICQTTDQPFLTFSQLLPSSN